ncbi:hypothetical protein [Hansschlegelia sp. KR7-227]|uniref:hypothetical protein n=1 Tax=Hansschlegelia sp. KR7-227 TaxID=3400914 RepID=UPI003C002172
MTFPFPKPTARVLWALAACSGLALAQSAAAQSDGPKTPLPPRDAPRAAQPGAAKPAQDPDWPCVQVKVGSMSYGQFWAGPPIEDAMKVWREDPAVADLVPVLVARRTSMEEVRKELDAFAASAGDKKAEKLQLLFAGVFEELNSQRGRLITGIERYARKQRALSERIKTESLKIAETQKDMASQNSPEGVQQQQALDWDTRIYDERSQSLTYVCESPVLLEQRAFDLAREIQARLG